VHVVGQVILVLLVALVEYWPLQFRCDLLAFLRFFFMDIATIAGVTTI